MRCFTIGYGNRVPDDFINLLQQHGVSLVVDVRIEATQARLNSYVKTEDPNKGIQGLLGRNGISYIHLQELGNPYREVEKWQIPYKKYLLDNADKLISRFTPVRPLRLGT